MYCRSCGKQIDDEAVVCVGCGVPVSSGRQNYCGHCGAGADSQAGVCLQCGVKLAPPPGRREWLVALILSILVGEFGVDRFYTGYVGLGILKLLTFGGCGIWWLVDVILIATGRYRDRWGNELYRSRTL